MGLRLHVFPPSPRAQKVMAIATHLGLPVDLHFVDLFGGGQNSHAFVAMNPNRRMPVLEDGDFVLWEANAISQHLAGMRPEVGLGARNAREQADINRWQFWDLAHWEPALGILVHEHFKKRVVTGEGPDPDAVNRGEEAFHACARVLDHHLASSCFVAADRLTVADFSLAAFLAFAEPARMPIDGYEHLNRWRADVSMIPAWGVAKMRGDQLIASARTASDAA